MLPVSHYDLLVVLAFTLALSIIGLVYVAVLVYRLAGQVQQGFAKVERLATVVGAMVYQEAENTRALLREHGRP